MKRSRRVEYAVISCGEPSAELSLASVLREVPKSSVKAVTDVRPLSSAFNRMLESDADWVVQVDSDFFLHPGFASRIEREADLAEKEEQTSGVRYLDLLFYLFDPFEQRYIGHCKVFQMQHIRREKVKFKNAQGCDLILHKEYSERGYLSKRLPRNEPIGEHYPIGVEEAYSRYAEISAKWGLEWLDKALFRLWVSRIRKEKSVIHASAVLGLLRPRKQKTEKDRRSERQDPLRKQIARARPDEIVDLSIRELKLRGLL